MSEMLPPAGPPPPPPPSAPPDASLPWERPSAGAGTIFPTISLFVKSPLRAFARMSLTVDLVRPIAYYVVLVLIGAAISQLWSAIFFEQVAGFLERVLPPELAAQIAPYLQKPGALQIVLGLVVTPLLMIVALFVWTAIVHAVLVVLGGAGGGFAATLRVVGYARTGDVALLLPLAGGLVAFFWRRGLEVAGLSTVHKSDPWKAVVAVVLPLVLCCGCVAVGIAVFGAALGAALQQMG